MLVLYAEGALEPDESRKVEEHIASCEGCRTESEQIGAIRGWLADQELFEPAQDLAWQLLPEKLVDRARAQQRPWSLPGFGVPRWAIGVAAILVLGAGLIWTFRYAATPPEVQPVQIAAGNEAFVNKVRTAYAREATAQYLAGCQNLLIDLVSADKKCDGNLFDVSLQVTRARQLLDGKRLLDSELAVPDVERTRSICDELERFLVNLSSSQQCETQDAIQGMERFIEREQLLLRINLAQSGIS
jgi:hypothetical protein